MVEAGEPLTSAYIEAGDWEVDIAGARYPATVSIRPMYDPRSERVRL